MCVESQLPVTHGADFLLLQTPPQTLGVEEVLTGGHPAAPQRRQADGAHVVVVPDLPPAGSPIALQRPLSVPQGCEDATPEGAQGQEDAEQQRDEHKAASVEQCLEDQDAGNGGLPQEIAPLSHLLLLAAQVVMHHPKVQFTDGVHEEFVREEAVSHGEDQPGRGDLQQPAEQPPTDHHQGPQPQPPSAGHVGVCPLVAGGHDSLLVIARSRPAEQDHVTTGPVENITEQPN